MPTQFRFLIVAILFASTSAFAQTTTTLGDLTANNTAACSAISGYCYGTFTGMSSSSSGVFNVAPGNASHENMQAMEYSGATTELYAHFVPWFCMQPGSSATGPGTLCNSHLQVGYNSNDRTTVHAQMDDMQARGLRGPIIDWYGPGHALEDTTTQYVRDDLAARCGQSGCPMQFGITEDQGSASSVCPMNGGGTDQSNCILQAMESDFDYMNTNYFPSPAYLRVDAQTMTYSPTGRPVVFFFFCESCFTNPTPNWSYIWNQLRAHVLAYTSGDPLIWFVFRNSVGFSHVQSDGAFAWINHYGSSDPYGLVYLDNFYDVSLQFPSLQPWGASWKGMDNSLAPWNPGLSVTPQQCGNTWVQTWAEMTHNSDYGPSHQLPFLQVVTWNDYEEGTEIETGIDNCLTLNASTDNTNLSWTLSFSASSGSEATVHHYEVFDSSDGQNLTQVATVSAGTHSVPISSLNLGSGTHILYVSGVGKASIARKVSNSVTYTAGPAPISVTGFSPTSGTTLGGTAITITGQGFETGATVTMGGATATVSGVSTSAISAVTPAHAAGTVTVTVTNPDGGTASASSGFKYVAPYFKLSASPTSETVTKGATASYSITVTPQYSYTGTVKFGVSGLPSGATASFSPTYVTTSGTAKLSVGTSNSAKGTFTLKVRGTNSSGTLSSTVSLKLTVQ